MNNLTKAELKEKIQFLSGEVKKQTKISNALLGRVKKNLKYQLNASDIFEHNSILLNQIKETKNKLISTAQASQRFSYLSQHDSLTGLYNRDVFNKKLKECVKNAPKGNLSHALFFLDLDQFKVVNDTAGHQAGDEMIKQLTIILLNVIDEDAILARLGGDEFGYILNNCTKKLALNKANQFLSIIDAFHFSWEEKLFTISVSIGVVLINDKTKCHIYALKKADMACFVAKNAGRNRYHLYKKGASDELTKHNKELKWLPKITNALENNLFKLYVQPIQSKKGIFNYEVLIRLEAEGKTVSPGVFLPPAERYNLISKIDSWVISEVFNWLEINTAQINSSIQFSINISGQSLGEQSILNLIVDLLESSTVKGENICFEVTETMAISNFSAANKFMTILKKYGCKFALDDFGSGLSSLSYLKNMKFDTLKIDGSFIRDILDDSLNEEMVKSINSIGHIMGMETVAEYVENKGIYEKLKEMNFDYLQGYFIGKPMPIENLLNKGS